MYITGDSFGTLRVSNFLSAPFLSKKKVRLYIGFGKLHSDFQYRIKIIRCHLQETLSYNYCSIHKTKIG